MKPSDPIFPDTRWTIVMSARGECVESRRALGELFTIYWFPLYAFARSMGVSAADAEDFTQAFCENLIESRLLERLSPERGRLRSYLLASLKNFILQEWRKGSRKKRGGDFTFVPIDGVEAEGQFAVDSRPDEDPERAFDRRWANTLLGKVTARLRHEFEKRGEQAAFSVLSPLLAGGTRGESYREAADQLDMTEGAVRAAVFRHRKRFQALLCEEIADTVLSPEDVDAEIEALFAAFAD